MRADVTAWTLVVVLAALHRVTQSTNSSSWNHSMRHFIL